MSKPPVLTGEHFMNGDTACAEGAIACGCRFFAGYPITPATEIAERMAERLPEIGGTFIQMEDEIAAMNAVIGGAWGGLKSMSATSGPGFSLMMENLGLAIMTETPCVLVDVQRAGPSTGLPTAVAQQDMMQARWGSHGDYEIIALSPNSPQEMFNMAVEAFNLSERYRVPVLIMADEVVGHMTEKVVIPPAEDLYVAARRCPPGGGVYRPFEPDYDGVPPMAHMGDGYALHATGLTHDERGYPRLDVETQDRLVRRLVGKIRQASRDLTRVERIDVDQAEVVLVTYGISSRTAMRAMRMAQKKGLSVGLLRLQVVWPFPDWVIEELAPRVSALVVPEINMGQMVREVQRAAAGQCRVVGVPHAGGAIHDPATIVAAIERSLEGLPSIQPAYWYA